MAERILVVEHEEHLRKVIVSLLTIAKYECREAADGMEALALLQNDNGFELVLSGLMMPNLDGMGLLERVKDRCPDIPVVLTSGVHDVRVALNAIRNGAYDYLLLPLEREQLLNAVSRAVGNRRLKLENRTYQMNLESLVSSRTDQLQSSLEEVRRSYDIAVASLAYALDLKAPASTGHSNRVTAFTMAIGSRMGVPKDEIEIIARAAFLHDIGKMGIPDSVLVKPRALNAGELRTMRDHPYLGYKLVQKFPALKEAAEIVYAHHENFDGTGYPRALKGEEIPIGARIVAVANTLDSITSDLPYRRARSLSAARAEIQRCAGTQFDPEVVRVFLQMPDSIWEALRSEVSAQK
jgi:response regulator RpfG family c-di-GMP phosphodiesterase